MKDLALYFMDVAKGMDIEYADIRVAHYRKQSIYLQDLSPKSIVDEESMGFGIRVLYEGAWGFASSTELSKEEIDRVLKRAYEIARASSIARGIFRVRLAEEPVHIAKFETPVEKDPFEVPLHDKIDLLYRVNYAMLKVKGIVKTHSSMELRKRHQFFASTEGSLIETVIYTTNAGYTAFASGNNDSQQRSFQDYPLNKGYEHIESLGLLENAERVANEAVMKLYADEPDEGIWTLCLTHPIFRSQFMNQLAIPRNLTEFLDTKPILQAGVSPHRKNSGNSGMVRNLLILLLITPCLQDLQQQGLMMRGWSVRSGTL